jgi:tetratricopeptide (TPR) repeat protein
VGFLEKVHRFPGMNRKQQIKSNVMNVKPTKQTGLLTAILLLFLICSKSLTAQVKISEQQWIIPTYSVSPADKNPMFFKGESYQGASRYIYPYGLNDVISNEKADKSWKTLILENEYIKLCVTPEIGGKLYYGTDKTNNYNFIYKNNVVKPSNIGMLGAWVSGGIEWCVIHHHRASTFLPVDYELAENEDGSKTIWIGETEPRHRMRWTIGITAYPGKSYYSADVKIENPTPYTHTFLYWANVAAHTNKDYQVIFPPSVQFATYHAKNSFTHWPISTDIYNRQDFTRGVDISWWINSPNSNSYFAYDLKEDFMGGYDHGKETGTVHIGDHNIVKGAKLWEWGSGARGQATEGRLTENDGPYVEIMVGAFSDNQPDYSWIQPYEVKSFKQYWYPVKDIKGFKNANLNGAVNLEKEDDNKVFLGYYSTQKISNARLVLKKKGEIIFEKTMEISPEIAFHESIKVAGTFNITDLYTEMINTETGEVLVSYQPVEKSYIEELPETVKRPELPKDIITVEELYLTGKRIQQFYNPTLDAMDYYYEALKRDPDDIRTNTAVGNIYLMNGDYLQARSYLSRAIKRLTKDYTRPSDCESLYLQGLTLKAMGLYDEATDTLYRATWDYAFHSAAYLELARISAISGDFTKALGQINESLATNIRNNSAICFKAGIQRRKSDYTGAAITLGAILNTDPLDFRAANESYLVARSSGNQNKADAELTLLNKKMRDFDFNYLELAVAYLNDGLYEEAEDILTRFKGNNPIISYYLGYISDHNGKKTDAEKYFKTGSGQSVDYIFPFRLETVKVLETALKYNPADGKAYYYLGNILYDRQAEKAIEYWENAVKSDPSLAVAHRNLGWGYYNHSGDGYKAISAYEKAIELDKNEPIYYEELDALYEMSNSPIEKRLKLFEGNNEIVGKRDDSFAREITVLTLAGKPEKAVEYLSGRNFSYREGSSRVRDIIIDAHLIMGIKNLGEKNNQKALENFLLAQVPEEEATGGRSGNRNIQVNYFIGLAYEALGSKTKAKNYFTLSAELSSRSTDFVKYYQGLSKKKLGRKAEASEIFNSLLKEGERQIEQSSAGEADFFAKFGEREAENARLSNAYLLKGLGYKGLGDLKSATENLNKAIELSASNLYAKVELN